MRSPQHSYFAGKNAGARAARGAIVALLDSDCEPVPEWLSMLTAPFADAGVSAVAGCTRYTGTSFHAWTFAVPDFSIVVGDKSGEASAFHLNNSAFRRETLLTHPLDARIRRDGGCVLLYHELRAAGARIMYAPQARVFHGLDFAQRGLLKKHFNRGFDGVTVYRADERAVLRGTRLFRRFGALALIAFAGRRILVDWLRLIRNYDQMGISPVTIPYFAAVSVATRLIALTGGLTAVFRTGHATLDDDGGVEVRDVAARRHDRLPRVDRLGVQLATSAGCGLGLCSKRQSRALRRKHRRPPAVDSRRRTAARSIQKLVARAQAASNQRSNSSTSSHRCSFPFPYARPAVAINERLLTRAVRRWIGSTDAKPLIVITFLPTPLARAVIRSLKPDLAVYYCADRFVETSAQAAKLRESEPLLLARGRSGTDDVARLAENRGVDRETRRVSAVRCTVRRIRARPACRDGPGPRIRRLDGPIIGFTGTLRNEIDVAMLTEVARLAAGSELCLRRSGRRPTCAVLPLVRMSAFSAAVPMTTSSSTPQASTPASSPTS